MAGWEAELTSLGWAGPGLTTGTGGVRGCLTGAGGNLGLGTGWDCREDEDDEEELARRFLN